MIRSIVHVVRRASGRRLGLARHDHLILLHEGGKRGKRSGDLTFATNGQGNGLAFGGSGAELDQSSVAGLQLYSLPAGDSIPKILGTKGARGLAMAPDGSQIYVAQSSVGPVQIVDRLARKVVGSILAT